MADTVTALGAYLFTTRISRKFDSVRDYLKRYDAGHTISESYYRDLEAGRKRIRVASAQKLCEQLELDAKVFYYVLLKDVVPPDLFGELVSQSAVATVGSIAEHVEKLSDDLDEAKRALMSVLSDARDSVTELSDNAMHVLGKDRALLASLHYVYSLSEVGFDDFYSVYERNGGNETLERSVEKFDKLDLAHVDWTRRSIRRRSRVVKAPPSDKGQKFKDNFIIDEVAHSLRSKNRGNPSDGTFAFSTMIPLTPARLDAIFNEGASKLAAMIQANEVTLDEEGAAPYFACVVLSKREEYDTERRKSRRRDRS